VPRNRVNPKAPYDAKQFLGGPKTRGAAANCSQSEALNCQPAVEMRLWAMIMITVKEGPLILRSGLSIRIARVWAILAMDK